MKKKFKVSQIRDLLNQVYNEKITFSRFVEILNEQAETKEQTASPESVMLALKQVWNECEQEKSLPQKIERILVVVAKRWGKDYAGSTVGIIGRDAIEICEKYGIDWENYH